MFLTGGRTLSSCSVSAPALSAAAEGPPLAKALSITRAPLRDAKGSECSDLGVELTNEETI